MPSKYNNISYDYYSKDIPYSTRFQAIRGIQSEDQVNFADSIKKMKNDINKFPTSYHENPLAKCFSIFR